MHKPFVVSLTSLVTIQLAAAALSSCSAETEPRTPAVSVAPLTTSPLPAMRVNQLGYQLGLAKWAVWVSDAATPRDWRLLDASGATVAEGETIVFGADETSGDVVHQIDFTRFEREGSGYRLVVDEHSSDPFALQARPYATLGRDALRFFYLMRSGTPIELPFAEHARWTHPGGHRPDLAHCSGDPSCDGTIEATGGWYDAGDHGKYVVNGGFSAWLLQHAYERTRAAAEKPERPLLGDRALNIPESGNGFPDILDEARWEIEFLLAMQIPDGKPLAGMAYHKLHDESWTPLGTWPHEDEQPRVVRPPSTAATLNLAAAAAQAARLWRELDPAFAARCLNAAERAFRAAEQHPARLAPASDSQGGGAYADDRVEDERYWAAAELWLSTGKAEYRQRLEASPLDAAIAPDLIIDGQARSSGVTWQRVDVLGKLSLLLASTQSRATEYRRQLAEFSERLLATMNGQGYRFPMAPGADGRYVWGSNADLLGNMILLASAADATKDERFVEPVVAGMDYLLGRNALAQSYVTGYGTRPLRHPHHRAWAEQANARYPSPPPGALSGGPNSYLQDPYVRAAGLAGCPPQKCFVDHIEAYSVNEVAINWNAALAWLTLWLDERAHGAG